MIRASRLSCVPSTDRRTVVGAVILADDRALAARRTRPTELAGYWEFPGGKVEPGEESRAALVREIEEELSATVEVRDEIAGGPWVVSDQYELRLFTASVVSGVPRAGTDHDEVRWLAFTHLDSVDWLPSDLAAVEAVKVALGMSRRA
ncbi:MAG TPA: NUDIX domain-containing protein [Mycobacteriales bacterium]|nr:NUDIX domain-containing protein [Mycobacteriales bacterium]